MPSAGTLNAYTDRSATISTTALTLSDIGFTQTELDSTDNVKIQVLSNPIRYRYDGNLVTASTGHRIGAGGELIINGNRNIQNLSMIREGGADANLWITLSAFGLLSVDQYHSKILSYDPVAFYDASLSTLWLEDTRITASTENNDIVGAWDDLSGNGHHIIQPTSSNRPRLKSRELNGNKVLRFDGIDDFLENASFPDFGDNYTVFFVAKLVSGGDISQGLYSVTTGTNNTGFQIDQSGNALFRAIDSVGQKFILDGDLRDGNWRLHTTHCTGSEIEYWINQASINTSAYSAPNPNTLNTLTVGAIKLAGWVINGDIAALIIFNRTHTDAERTDIENTLNNRYEIF